MDFAARNSDGHRLETGPRKGAVRGLIMGLDDLGTGREFAGIIVTRNVTLAMGLQGVFRVKGWYVGWSAFGTRKGRARAFGRG